jgi:glycosyltransferase involved in cell wall biosynthesis
LADTRNGIVPPAPVSAAPPGEASREAPTAKVHGYVDDATFEWLNGWAWYPDRPLEAVTLRVLADGVVIARVVANAYRADVAAAGIGTGRYGFELRADFKPPLGTTCIGVEDDVTGVALTHSPVRIEAPLQLTGPVGAAITALFDSPATAEELLVRATFVARQAERLLQRLSDRRSHRLSRAAQRARKWRWREADGPEPPRVLPRVLVIDNGMPTAGHDAGSHALLSHMASLRRLGFDLLFVPADMRAGPGSGTLDAMGIGYATEPWFASVEEVMRRQQSEFDLVYIHKHEPAARYVAMARHYMPRVRRIYAVADLHGLRLGRQGHVEERADLIAHADLVLRAEIATAAACHAVVTHSRVEAAILREALPHAQIEVIPWHVPVSPTPRTFAERHGVAFIGSYSHAPNLDAALWLRDEVLPLVWAQEPELRCVLAGADMPLMLGQGHDPRVKAVGHVEDLFGLLNEVRLTVAPLAYGAGLKGKVADSLAAGVPCVCSPIAAEGFDLPPCLHDLVAADAAGLAASIIRLHGDPDLFAACRQAGLDYISAGFNEAVVDAGLRRAAGLPQVTAA